MPRFPTPLQSASIGIPLLGMAMVAFSGARGVTSLVGFGVFCLGIAALDGVHRRTFGFRQVAIFLGILAVGLGLWTALATGLLVLLHLPVATALRSLLVTAAACAAGSAAMALLAVRSPEWLRGSAIGSWLGGAGTKAVSGLKRLGAARRGRSYDAGQPLRPAGPVRGD